MNINTIKKRLSLLIIILQIVINLACYKFLTSNIGIHFNISGNTDGTIPKLGFLILMPLLSVAIYLYNKIFKKVTEARTSASCGLILILNIVLLYINLK